MFRAFFRLPSRLSKTLRTLQENGSICLDERTPSSCNYYKILHRPTFFFHYPFLASLFLKILRPSAMETVPPSKTQHLWLMCLLWPLLLFSIFKLQDGSHMTKSFAPSLTWREPVSKRIYLSSWVGRRLCSTTCSSLLSCSCDINGMGNGSRSKGRSSDGI